MAQSSPIRKWEDIDRDSQEQQRLYLESKLQCRESIKYYKDIKLGDHLVVKGGMNSIRGMISYHHHFLCSGFDKQGPLIIHYYDSEFKRSRSKVSSTSYFGSASSLWKKGKIQEVSLQSYIKQEKLQAKENEVQRVVWPDEMRRFSREEAVRRAKERINEKRYNLIENNCESFIMWCLCDLNISLQVTPTRKTFCEVGSNALRKALSQIPQMAVDVYNHSKSVVKKFNSHVQVFSEYRCPDRGINICVLKHEMILTHCFKEGGLCVSGNFTGIVSILLSEAFCFSVEFYKMYKDWQGPKPMIKSKEDFKRKVSYRALLALYRILGSIGGMFAGPRVAIYCLGYNSSLVLMSIFCSYVGSILGGVLGDQIHAGISRQQMR